MINLKREFQNEKFKIPKTSTEYLAKCNNANVMVSDLWLGVCSFVIFENLLITDHRRSMTSPSDKPTPFVHLGEKFN